MKNFFTTAVIAFATLLTSDFSVDAQESIGVRLPSGFRIEQAAGPDLADDIYSMTVSDRGEVFVSSRGYLKRLNDEDGDGIFDSATLFSPLPKNGAQGILVEKDLILCTGDAGILSFEDANHDGIADGVPVCLLKTQTGVEHGAHALRIGPDGMLYFLAGNATPIDNEFYSDPDSPIKEPQAGFLMRMNLDGSKKQIVADGFRNAYDFDFNDAGEIFVYDSDGERDISLPWYRPTRVFQIRPGDSAGWLSVGWKRPSEYFDMPRTIAALGRGSPTGVETFRRKWNRKPAIANKISFPKRYDQAVLVGDWTFGRVIALVPKNDGYERVDFAIAEDQFGFAVTDLAFTPDGSLLVSVGGRGTRGAIYRITSTESSEEVDAGVADEARSKARAIWANELSNGDLLTALNSDSSMVREAALSQWVAHPDLAKDPTLGRRVVRELVSFLESPDLATVGLAFRVAQSIPADVVEIALVEEWSDEVKLLLHLAIANDEANSRSVLMSALEMLPRTQRANVVIRAAQLAMGGCTRKASDEIFAGYEPRIALNLSPEQIQSANRAIAETLANRLAELGSLEIRSVEERRSVEWQIQETGRVAAMLGPQLFNDSQTDPLALTLHQILLKQSVVDGGASTSIENTIHWLVVAARATDPRHRSDELKNAIVDALFAIQLKRQMNQQTIDRNFYPRLTSLVKRLIADDRAMQQAIAKQFDGSEASLFCYEAMPGTVRKMLNGSIANFLTANQDQATFRQVQILANSDNANERKWVRMFQDRPEFQVPVLQGVSQDPLPEDYLFLRKSLESREAEVLKFAAIGMRRLVESDSLSDDVELDLVARAILGAKQLGWDRAEISARDQLVLLARSATKREFGYSLKGFEQSDAERSLQVDALERWIEHGKKTYGQRFVEMTQPKKDPAVAELMKRLKFDLGDPHRGREIYQKAKCSQCHDAGNRLGPRLDGISKRFSREDLIRSIVDPSENIPDRYQAVAIATHDGNVITGTIVYDSVAGVVIQTADGMTASIREEDIEQRQRSSQSLMPAGLMENASDQDWSDLIRFLESK